MKRVALAACAVFLLSAGSAVADDDDDDRRHNHRYEHHHDADHYHHGKKHGHRKKAERHAHHHGRHGHRHGHRRGWHGDGGHGSHGHAHKPKRKKAKKRVYVEKHIYHDHPKRHRHGGYHGRWRDGGHGYRQRHDDRDWALFAMLALQIVDVLNESQRHSYVHAQQRATQAPLGETIRWNDGPASGRLVPLRDGSDRNGRYCREFQQEIIVGSQRRSGYGVACRQPDGAWELLS